MAVVYVSVSGGIADAEVVEGDVEIALIDWDSFDEVDLTDAWVEDDILRAYRNYQLLPKGHRERRGVRTELLNVFRRRRDQIADEAAEAEAKRERDLDNARKVLQEAGEL